MSKLEWQTWTRSSLDKRHMDDPEEGHHSDAVIHHPGG